MPMPMPMPMPTGRLPSLGLSFSGPVSIDSPEIGPPEIPFRSNFAPILTSDGIARDTPQVSMEADVAAKFGIGKEELALKSARKVARGK